jgi:hypothetical protein
MIDTRAKHFIYISRTLNMSLAQYRKPYMCPCCALRSRVDNTWNLNISSLIV